MNKKGVFVVFLSILSIFLLLATAIVIIKNNDVRQEKLRGTIGQDAQALLALAEEYSKYKIYIHEILPFAQQRAKEAVIKNGGYQKNNTCEKIQKSLTDTSTYILLNTCEPFNPTQAYYTQLAQELETYLSAYIPFPNTIICFAGTPQAAQVLIDASGLYLQKQLPLNSCTKEPTTKIELQATIKEPVERFDEDRYEYLYDVLSSCTDLSTCQEKIQILLPQSIQEIQQDILFIDAQEVKIAFKQGPLPQRQQSRLFGEE